MSLMINSNLVIELYKECRTSFEQPTGVFVRNLPPPPSAVVGREIVENREAICDIFRSIGIRMESNPDTIHCDWGGYIFARTPFPGLVVHNFIELKIEEYLDKKKLN